MSESATATAPAQVLLTGFEPFEQDVVNPSWEIARALDGWHSAQGGPAGAVVHAVQLPCVFGAARVQLEAALDRVAPALVICLGGSSRSEITPERVAINVDDARIADNAGRQPIDLPVIAEAPTAYFSTLPVKAIVRDLRAAGLPASVSNTAGTFVCNHVFFALMHRLAQDRARLGAAARGGFIHVPYLPQQAARLPGAASMALDLQVAALRHVIDTALAVELDIRETAGQLY